MEISEAVTDDYREFGPETPSSKLLGAFQTHGDDALLIVDGGVRGVVTRKQLVSSHHDPDQKAANILRDDVPEIGVHDDIREVARLMVESELDLLPVYDREEGGSASDRPQADDFRGVVTAESVARAVEPFLDALDVNDVYSRDLRWVSPETTLGQVINTLRVNGISRVPVVDDDGDLAGMISYYDLLSFTVREVDQESGGNAPGFDGHGGAGSSEGYRSHRGFGERAGVEHPLIDLPARDVMNSPVSVTGPTTSLDEAVHEMLADDYSSLVVTVPDEGPDGIVTLTDVLRSLTWTPDAGTRLQVFGARYLADLSRADVADLIEGVTEKYEEMDVIEAYVILHEHRERVRGSPLIRATIRLFTDRGRFAGTGEEYGDAPAIRAARDRLERTVLDDKGTRIDDRQSQRSDEETERLLSWWLET